MGRGFPAWSAGYDEAARHKENAVDESRHILTQLVITEEQQAQIDSCLEALKTATQAASALLIERSGLLISAIGDPTMVELPVAPLIAGLFKSLTALTSLMGEPAVQTMVHHGQRSSMLLCMLESQDMLAVMAPPGTNELEYQHPMEVAIRTLTPLLIAARESTRHKPFAFKSASLSTFLGRL